MLYSAGVPTANWRPVDDYQPLSFSTLMFTGDGARAVETPPANVTGQASL